MRLRVVPSLSFQPDTSLDYAMHVDQPAAPARRGPRPGVTGAEAMDQTLKQIASRNAGPWLETRDAEMRAARAAGQRAATGDMALLLAPAADFQEGCSAAPRPPCSPSRATWPPMARDLQRQVEDLARERDDHIGQRMTDLREERQRALHALDSTKGPMSAPFVRAALASEEAEKALRAVRAQVNGRPLRRGLVHVYLPLMAALALVEVPVNRLAFELFFQEQPAGLAGAGRSWSAPC